MSVNIIVGCQWGDEGKGRITDLMAAQSDIVARYSGGDNAGHTVTIGENIFKLHLIPSGIVHPHVIGLLGGGVVINPQVLLREMGGLVERGVDVSPERLKISRNAHLITPAHIALDKAAETQRGRAKIGTTQRGIGPAYTDKTARDGLRAHLLSDPEALADAIVEHIEAKNLILENIYNAKPLDADAIATRYCAYARELAPHLVDGPTFLHEALAEGKRILAEGAQGTMLDLDHGTYPFVTSSSPLASGALVGLGLGPKSAENIIGIAKAFSSRVGSGIFLTELDGEMALRLRGTGANPWDEYGTTTGRPRRVGWLDLPVIRYAIRLNSMTNLVITKLDILSGLDTISVCTGYDLNGTHYDTIPLDPGAQTQCRPIYEQLNGWHEDITSARDWSQLPSNAQKYLEFIEAQVGIPITIVSVGPERSQTISR